MDDPKYTLREPWDTVIRHVHKLSLEGKQIDVVTVSDSLEDAGELAKVGGVAYVWNIREYFC